ncbi:MAG: indolepyruvate oxidoreductase subunit beta family protein [Burkholderiales bacterium]|nr:indolepyruvate oxidoreductase subunit beta family protein [Burkholderiales bacterium]
MTAERPVTILVCALGGEGGGVLAQWLVETAIAAGHSVQSTSIPGVAQRTGATTYYIEVFPRPDAELGGRKPVFSLTPVPGALDLLVSSELLETVRQIANGMGNAQRTQVISARSRTLTTAEKMPLGDGRADAQVLMRIVREHSAQAHLLDMAAITQSAGTVISAVLFGAIAASGVLPFARQAYQATIAAGGRGAQASLRGFDAAFEALASMRNERAAGAADSFAARATPALGPAAATFAAPAAPAPAPAPVPVPAPAARLVPAWLREFPAAVHEVAALGHARVLEYQDLRYAQLYLERLRRVLAAERGGDPAAANGFATTRETARHLALWMAFDDIVRVAELKCRAARFERVRAEVRAGASDLLRVHDHFKPGVAEFAALLPAAWADRLTRWERRRSACGRIPWALPIRLPSHTVAGLLALRGLAALKCLRRHGSRFQAEQALIERWLAAVEHGARQDAALGRELAECGRLIKGYGATSERGKDNLLHVVEQLARTAHFETPAARAAAVHEARRAALADDAGTALDQALVNHGAPPRPIKAQPVHWVRQRPGGRAGEAAKAADAEHDVAA